MHRSSHRLSGMWIALATAVALAACATSTGSPSGATSASASVGPSASASIAPSTSSGPTWTYLAFGDSWPYGAHCNGCQPFPGLYAEGLAATTGRHIDFVNRTTNGGTAQELLQTIKSSEPIRADIAGADIIVMSIGANDLEPAFDSYVAGTCGGLDSLDCFRDINETLRAAYEGMMTEIDGLRDGKPTAIRLVASSNEFLTDPGLIELFGAGFGTSGGVVITTLLRDTQCEVAHAHPAECVDLGLALNGPDLLVPKDINTQETMQLVADTILATGLDELQ